VGSGGTSGANPERRGGALKIERIESRSVIRRSRYKSRVKRKFVRVPYYFSYSVFSHLDVVPRFFPGRVFLAKNLWCLSVMHVFLVCMKY